MNIGNSYASWIHNSTATGYGNGSRTAKNGNGGADFLENVKNDTSVINNAASEKTKAEESAEEKGGEKNAADMTYREQILAYMEEMAKKVKDGTVEPTFQTGAQSFTIKEWEKLLADFDDAEEALQEQIKELIAEVEKQAAKEALRRQIEGGAADPDAVAAVSVPEAALPDTSVGGSVANPKAEGAGGASAPAPGAAVAVADTESADKAASVKEEQELEETGALLTDEVTKCSFPTDDPKNKHWYITCYGQDGIMCKEAYMENGKWVNKDCWSLTYTEPGQYEKVMAFLQRFPKDANLRFAAHENFWKDFLAGEIDEDDFVNFFETSTDKDGVPNYTYEKDGSTYIDREKAKYAKYMNDFSFHAYTREEFDLIQRAVMHENRKRLPKISDYDGQMTIPGGTKTGEDEEEDDLETKIITKPDGSVVLQIKTSFGVMEIEVTEAQKFGLQYEARPETGESRIMSENPFVHTANAVATYGADE